MKAVISCFLVKWSCFSPDWLLCQLAHCYHCDDGNRIICLLYNFDCCWIQVKDLKQHTERQHLTEAMLIIAETTLIQQPSHSSAVHVCWDRRRPTKCWVSYS